MQASTPRHWLCLSPPTHWTEAHTGLKLQCLLLILAELVLTYLFNGPASDFWVHVPSPDSSLEPDNSLTCILILYLSGPKLISPKVIILPKSLHRWTVSFLQRSYLHVSCFSQHIQGEGVVLGAKTNTQPSCPGKIWVLAQLFPPTGQCLLSWVYTWMPAGQTFLPLSILCMQFSTVQTSENWGARPLPLIENRWTNRRGSRDSVQQGGQESKGKDS